MREILPGVFHWTVDWPGVFPLESYWLKTDTGSILIDPIEGPDLGAIEESGDVLAVILTTGGHERSAGLFARRTGATMYIPAVDERLIENPGEYATYEDGETLPGRMLAIATPGQRMADGEHALLSPLHGGTLIVGDCLGTAAKWTPWEELPLGGHPRNHPHPAESLSHLLDHEFENLLPGHGQPILGGARAALQKLIESGVSTSPPAGLD
jgi:glyoxylase-like metal-dependent hydrolase (beta-lactamase superfamily II)